MATRIGTGYIPIKGDWDRFNREVKTHGRKLGDRFRDMGRKHGRAMAVGLGAGLGVGVTAVKGFVDAAAESEKSATKMRTQLDALGIDYGKHAKQIDAVIQKHSRLSGIDDEDLQDSFTAIARVTGDVNESLKLNELAMDIARAKNMDVAKAGELVAKVAGGNTGILKRYGIEVKDGATAQEALAGAQRKFAGQAEAYGKTAAGAQERFGVATENLQEKLGEKLLPIVSKVADKLSKFVDEMTTGEGAGGRFADKLRKVADVAGDIVKFFKDHPDLIKIAIGAWGAYKVASLAALATINVKRFRAAFFKSVPAAAAAGTAAGGAFAASSNTAAAAGMTKGKGKFRGAALAIGKFMGPLVAIPLAFEIGKEIEKFFNPSGTTAKDLGNKVKKDVEGIIEDMTGRNLIGPNTPRSKGTDRTDAGQRTRRLTPITAPNRGIPRDPDRRPFAAASSRAIPAAGGTPVTVSMTFHFDGKRDRGDEARIGRIARKAAIEGVGVALERRGAR